MKIKDCRTGVETDTDTLPDMEAFIAEKVDVLCQTFIQHDIPHIIFARNRDGIGRIGRHFKNNDDFGAIIAMIDTQIKELTNGRLGIYPTPI